MSQQLQITGGAKVRSLEGVITGSTGVLGSLPINGANGIPQLDSNGKILVSQLPNSVMEYKGTWNVTTNTPYLVNGTGNTGDVYLVEGAATGGTSHDFGAGAITFYNGDQVIYSGSIWQRGAGSSGTVTSVAITESGDALTITGSPITNSGTINIGFAGTSAQYVAGNGALVTFPALTGYVPYTGATATLDMGLFDVNARGFKVNGTAGSGHVDFKHQSGTPTGSASSTTLYADTNGDMAWKNDHNYITTFDSHLNTADRIYTLPNASGTVALTSDLSAYVPTSRTLTINGVTYDLSANRSWTISTGISGSGTTNYISKWTGSTALGNSLIYDNGTNVGIGTASPTAKLSVAGTTAISGQLTLGDTITNGTYTYTLPGATGVLALTSDLTIYVTLGTLQTITGTKIYSSLQYFDNNVYIKHGISGSSAGYTTLGASASGLNINLASGTSNNSLLFASTSASNTYTFPNATGTIALTTDLANYLPLTGGTLTGALTGTNASFNYVSFNNSATAPPTITGFSSLSFISNGSFLSMNVKRADGQRTTINIPNDGLTHQYDFPTTDGTIALTSNLSSYVPTSRTLTINGTTYDLSANRSWTVSGSQWTTTGSNIYYNTGNVGIGTTTPTDSSGFGTILDLNGSTASAYYTRYNGSGTIYALFGQDSSTTYLLTKSTPLSFYVNNAERMRIASTGNVSISPLDGESLKLQLATSTGNNYLRFYSSAGSGLGYIGSFYNGSSQYLLVDGSSTDLSLNGNANVYIKTAGNTRILTKNSSNGTVIFGTAEAAANSFNFAQNYSNGQPGFDVYNSSSQIILSFNGNTKALQVGNLGTGLVYSNAGFLTSTNPSDQRLKDNIETLTYGLKDILKLRPVSYNWKNDKANQGTQFGFIAQEVQEVIPEAIKEFGENIKYLGLEKDAIYAALINAIKELNDKIEKLQNN